MSDIKSAWEIAQEKLAQIGAPTPEERLEWKYVPEGEKLAAKFLKDDVNLEAELNKYADDNVRKYVARGLAGVLIKNIDLPRNDAVKKTNKRVMDALKGIRKDKVATENVFSKIRRVFSHYVGPGEEQRKEAYDQMKLDFARRFQKALEQQMGAGANMRIDVEKQPEFQAEWRRVSAQMERQYQQLVDEYKVELAAIE
ncbi:MAG: hypothetical protein V1894_03360 [Chloroflexota bacterium]